MFRTAVILIFGLLSGVSAMAQSLEDIKKETALIEAETARLNAQTAKIAAERARTAAEAAPDTTLKDLQAQAGIANAQKDLAAAQTNAKIAELFGDVKAGPYSGAVEVKDKAGTVEATLLASRAVATAGQRISTIVAPSIGAGKPLLVIPARSFESFQRLNAYRFRKLLVENAMSAALPRKNAVGVEEAVAAPAIAAAGLDAVGKLLGFFKTDFVVGGIDVKIEEAAAVFALAGTLSKLDKKPNVFLPQTYMPKKQMEAVQDLAEDMTKLGKLRDQVVQQAESDTAELEKLGGQVGAAQGDEKKKMQARIAKLRARLPDLTAAKPLYDAFVASLVTPEASGVTPLSALANEMAISALIQEEGARVLLVRLEATGGGYLVKKNLWTGLGAAAPLYHMGGVAMSFTLFDGPSAKVLAGDTVAVHGGYLPTRKVANDLQ
jgi:hypothetical protein